MMSIPSRIPYYLKDDLNGIVYWADRNSLVLNPNKTKFMVIGSRIGLNSTPSLNIILMSQSRE